MADILRGLSQIGIYQPAHPGEILKELVIKPLGLNFTQASKNLNISRKTLSKVINGCGAITPEMAERLKLAFAKPSADHWPQLQKTDALRQARQLTLKYKVQID